MIKTDGNAALAGRTPCLAPGIQGANVMGIHSPYATTIWDYINRGMPFGKEGTLKPNEVYSLTAFLLYKNGVIPEDQILDEHSLPQVKMPNRKGFVLPDGSTECRVRFRTSLNRKAISRR